LTSSFTTPADPTEHPAGTRFTLDFHATDDLEMSTQRWTTYWDVERLCRGPEPTPDWVVSDRGAVDTELGILKTGKEADVFLLHRAVPGTDGVVLAAKRYRTAEHTTFHRSSTYTQGRRTRNTRDARALAKKSRFGREIASGRWAMAEWDALRRLWLTGVPVPYPVQIDGTELLMELVVDPESPDGSPAPRLASTRPEAARLRSFYDQLRELLATMAAHGIAHGDLSPYNVLAAGERLVVIDLPQVVDLVANPAGPDFLHRDCLTMVRWFRRRGLDVDAEDLFAEVIAAAF
jgi:RIO kinase 1